MTTYGLTITYIPWGASSPVTLTLPGGIFGEESGYVDGSIDFQRTLDGTANTYRAFNKRRKVLKWDYLTDAQKEAMETLWTFGGPFTVADAVDLDNQFTCLMIAEPKFQQDYYHIWSGSVEVQEI